MMRNELKKQRLMNAIGERLKNVCRHLRISQIDLASTLKKDLLYLEDIESGKIVPDAEFFLKLAESHCVNPNYLLLGIGNMSLGTNDKVTIEDIDLYIGIDSVEKLVLMMELSSFFRHTMYSLASHTIYSKLDLIQETIKISKFEQETPEE